ncbi:MAG: hypothetical protein WKF40_00080 [Thermoleophilaceae bacterium]
MTMVTLGVAADEADAGIGANTLWPRTLIATAAVQDLLGGEEAMRRARTPVRRLTRRPSFTATRAHCTGHSFIDDEVLAEEGNHRSPPGTARWPTPTSSSTCSWTAGPMGLG